MNPLMNLLTNSVPNHQSIKREGEGEGEGEEEEEEEEAGKDDFL